LVGEGAERGIQLQIESLVARWRWPPLPSVARLLSVGERYDLVTWFSDIEAADEEAGVFFFAKVPLKRRTL
jgi:hypothetical protein